MKQEVKTGKATVRCQLGESVEDYEVEIEKININSKENKGMGIFTEPYSYFIFTIPSKHCINFNFYIIVRGK